jgi:hypothetical protein
MSRKRPLGPPLALKDAALDARTTPEATAAAVPEARALWQQALRGTPYAALADLLDATVQEPNA